MLIIRPMAQRPAKAFVEEHHRHSKVPQGSKFQLSLIQQASPSDEGEVVGVIIVGRPPARNSDDGVTAEITRCCVKEGIPNGCSILMGAACKAAKAMGYERIITYTLSSESGSSLKGAGLLPAGEVKANKNGWSRASRPRQMHLVDSKDKLKWVKVFGPLIKAEKQQQQAS